MTLTLLGLSLVGGFLSGLLGVGGAVVMIPLMLAIPPLVGAGHLTMSDISGISMIQVLAASVSGCLAHRRHGHVHGPTLLAVGLPMGVCALAGALLSRRLDHLTMLILFGVLVIIAFVMLLLKEAPATASEDGAAYRFNAPLSITVGCGVGTVSGIVGAGGGFILIPLMITVLKVPMRMTVGSSLGIVFIGAVMGSVGKMLTMQIPWNYLLPVLLGSIPAAQIGARVSRSIPAVWIKRLLLLVVFLSLISTCWDIVKVFTHAG